MFGPKNPNKKIRVEQPLHGGKRRKTRKSAPKAEGRPLPQLMATKFGVDNQWSWKLGLIFNSFIEIFCDYRPTKQAWFPFLDLITLLFQKPLALSVFEEIPEKESGRTRVQLVMTTFRDIEFYPQFDPLIKDLADNSDSFEKARILIPVPSAINCEERRYFLTIHIFHLDDADPPKCTFKIENNEEDVWHQVVELFRQLKENGLPGKALTHV